MRALQVRLVSGFSTSVLRGPSRPAIHGTGDSRTRALWFGCGSYFVQVRKSSSVPEAVPAVRP